MSKEVKRDDKPYGDIHIIQDPKILQQVGPLLRNLPHGMKNQINVIMINQLSSGGSNGKFDFFEFLESLPEPRLQSLKELAYRTAYKKLRKTYKAANFLGVGRQSFGVRLRELESEVDQEDPIEIEDKGEREETKNADIKV